MDSGLVTLALKRVDEGAPGASEELWQLVYNDLRRMAQGRLNSLRAGETLQATALVHEAWMKMGGPDDREWKGRAHFFGAAALSMRNILVDQARRKHAVRRGGGVRASALDTEISEGHAGTDSDPAELLALDEALTELGKDYERPAQIVMLRYFAGLTIPEVADLLEVTTRVIDREFLFARTWLRRFMERGA